MLVDPVEAGAALGPREVLQPEPAAVVGLREFPEEHREGDLARTWLCTARIVGELNVTDPRRSELQRTDQCLLFLIEVVGIEEKLHPGWVVEPRHHREGI